MNVLLLRSGAPYKYTVNIPYNQQPLTGYGRFLYATQDVLDPIILRRIDGIELCFSPSNLKRISEEEYLTAEVMEL